MQRRHRTAAAKAPGTSEAPVVDPVDPIASAADPTMGDDRKYSLEPIPGRQTSVTSFGSSSRILPEKQAEKDPEIAEDDPGQDQCCLPRTWCRPESRCWAIVLRLGACVLAGILFGWCLEKGRVFAPSSIRLQMVFERWIMLKMFLAAVATGQISLAIVALIPGTRDRFQEGMDSFGACFGEKGILTSLLGPFILGAGMTLSGACPGMVLAQVGSWTKNAYLTFIGTLIGALLYGLVAPYIVKLTRPNKPLAKQTVHETIGTPYYPVAFVMGGLLLVTVFLMEWFINWKDDLDPIDYAALKNDTNVNIFTIRAWPPAVSGSIIGLLQVVILLSVGDTLGGSSSYVTIVSQWVVGSKLKQVFPYLARARCGIGNWWQVFYVGAAVLGGCFSALSSNSLATTYGVNVPTALTGGILLLLGARLGAGCTSGHGLSGMGLLYWLSFMAVPAMFAGGIVTAFSMKATGALTDWDYH